MHFWAPGTVPVVGPYAGSTRTLDEQRGVLRKEVGMQQVLSAEAKAFQPQVLSADAKAFHPASLFLGKEQTGRVWRETAPSGVSGQFSCGCSLPFYPGRVRVKFVVVAPALVMGAPRPLPLGLSVQYQRASLVYWDSTRKTRSGLCAPSLDNRLSASSWTTIKSGVKRWRACASELRIVQSFWQRTTRNGDPRLHGG